MFLRRQKALRLLHGLLAREVPPKAAFFRSGEGAAAPAPRASKTQRSEVPAKKLKIVHFAQGGWGSQDTFRVFPGVEKAEQSFGRCLDSMKLFHFLLKKTS